MNFAAIEIGSNSVRCLIASVKKENDIIVDQPVERLRYPIRLGVDSFAMGNISEEKVIQIIDVMKEFVKAFQKFKVVAYKAYATSAMRHAKNAPFLLQKIKEETDLEVQVIDGATEASLVTMYQSDLGFGNEKTYLYIDVGGGSTEISLLKNQRLLKSRSFEIGAIRLLQGSVTKENWSALQSWLELEVAIQKPQMAIGCGGNIRQAFLMSGNVAMQPLHRSQIKGLYEKLLSFSDEERVAKWNLKPDRADVIVPALEIFLFIMNHGGIETVVAPQIGVAEGMIRQVYLETTNGANK